MYYATAARTKDDNNACTLGEPFRVHRICTMDEGRRGMRKLVYITSHVVDRDESKARNKGITGHRPLLEGEQPQPAMYIVRYDNVGEMMISYLRQFPVVLLHQGRVNLNLSRCKCGGSDKLKSWVAEILINNLMVRDF